jgi:hypothetical protein
MSKSASSVCRRLVHAALAVAVTGVALQGVPAAAAPASPVITGPSGSNGPTIEITWTSDATATSYEVQVDDDSGFGSPEWSVTTVRTTSVPTRMFATGSQFVRVRAKDASNAWSDWAETSFTVNALAGPSLTGPADGATLAQPDEPSLLTWSQVEGATGYTVEIDTEDGFVDPTTVTTKATSHVITNNQAPYVDYYWRVRATLSDGVATDYSEARSFDVQPIGTPEVVAPTNDEDITDVVLDWKPVRGAQYYELEVDDDFDFSSKVTGIPAKILGTRFSPKTTFGNDQYYWRVRARDLDGNPTEWVNLSPDVHYAFDRVWRDTPQPVHPLGIPGAPTEVHDDLYFEWTPVQHASHYQVWVSTDANFTTPSAATTMCDVAGTTFTPGETGPFDQCMPKTEGTIYYWKVRPIDAPLPELGIFSEPQAFVYTDEEAFRILTPEGGDVLDVPTVDWSPVPGTLKYEVSLYNRSDAKVDGATTFSTSYTARTFLAPGDGPYRWRIRALDASGRTSLVVASGQFDMSTEPPDTSTPLEPYYSAPTFDAPNLSWGAVEDAAYYKISIRNATTGYVYPSSYGSILSDSHYYPAATDLGAGFLESGSYKWSVRAFDLAGDPLGSSPEATFTVQDLGPVTGQRLALTGSALDENRACTKTLEDGATELCDGLPATPVLDWDPVPYASEYRVHVSKDGDFTSGALTASPPRTVNTRWAPRFTYAQKALQDSQAQTPYFWFIQPCKTPDICGPDPRSTVNPARHAFRKISPPVKLQAPADQAVESGTEVTFAWEDYYDTNRATTYAPTGEQSYQSAKSYEIQVSLQPTFSTIYETAVVDQPTYTSAEKLYPDGPVYWRVQVIDANDNRLGWSPTRKFTKTSPRPELTSPVIPAGGSVPVVDGAVPFQWKAMPFAGAYNIQVAANNDANFSATNLKVNKQTKRAAYATGAGGVATLPASDTPYVWRVSRVDAAGNAGPWSTPATFKVTLPAPTLASPAAGAVVGPRNLVLRWLPRAGAAKYKVEYRQAGLTATPPSAITPATAFAPPTGLTTGATYEWRVQSIDADNRPSAPGPWRTFTMGGTPTATVAAKIDGTGVFDSTLTAVSPTWSVPGVTETYSWRRNGQPIPGATAKTYRVAVGDVGASLTVVVTGSSPEFGTGTSTSAAITGKPGAGPVATKAPVVSGTGQVGSTLTSTATQWDRAGTATTLQWVRNGQPITGATSATYTLVAGDLNNAIALEATGTLPGRTPTVVTSNAITAVQGPAVTATAPPKVQGTPKVGATLTSTAPTWTQSGVQNNIQWLRNGYPVSGATLATFTVGPEDVGATLAVRYTGRVAGRADGVATSAPVTGLVGDAPVALGAARMSGTPKVGMTLSAVAPVWDLDGVQSTLQWLRDGAPIAGATSSTYAVVPQDVGKALAVRYVGRLAGHKDATSTSAAVTALLGDAPTAPALPVPSGTSQVGSTLTAPTATWTPVDVVETHQWLRDGQPISGATGTTYAVVSADVGRLISVRITATAPGRAPGQVTSRTVTGVAAPVVPPPPSPNPTPTPTPTPTPAPTPTPTSPTPTTPSQPVSSTTSVKAPKKVAPGKRAVVTVTVVARGATPTGVVKVYAGKKVVGTLTLTAPAKGVGKVKLAKLGKGRYKLRAVYAGGPGVTGSGSAKVALVVG